MYSWKRNNAIWWHKSWAQSKSTAKSWCSCTLIFIEMNYEMKLSVKGFVSYSLLINTWYLVCYLKLEQHWNDCLTQPLPIYTRLYVCYIQINHFHCFELNHVKMGKNDIEELFCKLCKKYGFLPQYADFNCFEIWNRSVKVGSFIFFYNHVYIILNNVTIFKYNNSSIYLSNHVWFGTVTHIDAITPHDLFHTVTFVFYLLMM